MDFNLTWALCKYENYLRGKIMVMAFIILQDGVLFCAL